MYLYKVGTHSSVLINQMSLFQRCPLRDVPLYTVVCTAGYTSLHLGTESAFQFDGLIYLKAPPFVWMKDRVMSA